MTRVDEILGWKRPEGVIDSFGIENAFCACLEPAEGCELLRRCVVDRIDLRAGALRKVCADVDRMPMECHSTLVTDLLALFPTVDSRARQSLGYCLSTIASHIDASVRQVIQKFFLSSPYISVRRRGYKSIGSNTEGMSETIERAWSAFADPECAWVITKTYPVSFLIEHRAELMACFNEGWQFSRLYLRIGEVDHSLVEELKEINEISYCYVLAKLGRSISLGVAKAIASRASQEEQFGLLIWSFGQMKLWAALKHIDSELVTIQEARMEALYSSYGVQPSVPPDVPAVASRRQGRG